MKLKHHLSIALVIILVSLFLTALVTTTAVPALGVDKESTTSIWKLMWENLFTDIPSENTRDSLVALGLPESVALDLIEEHGTGTSFLSGLLGLLPILGLIGGITGLVILELKKKFIKPLLYGAFGLVFFSFWLIWFTAPSKLNGIESMYNSLNAINPAFPATMGTMMVEGTEITMAIGLLFASIGSLYGIGALILNNLNKIEL
ncbi:hypothetical protein HF295_07170 [Hujiaoplasma nucleasis]|uniref:Uncharacterized protein n=1 Tax=Hujiaoplasma nucleasis TaxID=2725268 RepID=A0A7L6N6L4_9MOLU|nr:hypothetical protein [Hujiaoplasma nucleasis]QLY40635.1 hypothetical protein HF295_07170 [Hujiaoplasma nucleasis]